MGSVLCSQRDQTTAQLRLLLVEPGARGRGVGARLVDDCVRFARAGYQSIVLWTTTYWWPPGRSTSAGFEFTDEETHHSFGQDLDSTGGLC